MHHTLETGKVLYKNRRRAGKPKNYAMDKILILDDSTDLLEMMKNILERNAYTVKIVRTPDHIYSQILEFQPDLLILDIFLPGTDGREICKELRNNTVTKHLAVLAFSATPKNLVDYKSYYADDFMEKPFDIKMLIAKIRSLLPSVPQG